MIHYLNIYTCTHTHIIYNQVLLILPMVGTQQGTTHYFVLPLIQAWVMFTIRDFVIFGNTYSAPEIKGESDY